MPPDSFWAEFVAQHWEKRPVVLRRPFARPLASPEELFEAVAGAAERQRSGEVLGDFRFYVGRAQARGGLEERLPRREDGSTEGYVSRLGAELDGQPFTLALARYTRFSPDHFARARELLCGLYKVIGFPPSGATAALFMGKYPVTPFGVHKDVQGVFVHVVEGRKRFLVWPFEVFALRYPHVARHPEESFVLDDLADYEPFRSRAIVLTGEPGDVIYWPSSYWHIAESDGGFSSSIHLGVRPRTDLRAMMFDQLTALVDQRLGEGRWVEGLEPGGAPPSGEVILHERLSEALARLTEVISGPALHKRVLKVHLIRLSSMGLDGIPDPVERPPLEAGDVVRGDRRCPIVWSRAGEALLVAANGYVRELPASDRWIEILQLLNRCEPIRVARLVEDLGDALGPDREESEAQVEMLLDVFHCVGALLRAG